MRHDLSSPANDRHVRYSQIATMVVVMCVLVLYSGCSSNNGGGGNGGNGGGGGTPALTANVVTQGNFSSGEQNATYTIQVTNSGTAATSGTVTIVDPPTGFTITAMTGTNWSCTVSTGTCTYGASVAAGQNFPPITVTGNVTASNGTPVNIPLSASGGGASSASSTPTVTVAAPVLSITKSHSGNFDPGQQGGTYTVTVKNGTSAGATNAKVTVTETVPSGETLVSMSGTGWTCPGSGGANTCDRSDVLASGASYAAITVKVNVSSTAISPQTNQVSVSGGGMSTSVSTTDPTTINPPATGPDVSIAVSHNGNFGAGTSAIFTLAVANVGNAATTGTITVTDTLASQLGYVSGNAAGWTCGASGQVVTCTNPGPLAVNASAVSIPLVVSVNSSASGSIANTASVSTTGDTNSSNNSSTDNATVIATGSLPESISFGVPGGGAGGVIYAGGNAETANISVTNEGSGDSLAVALSLNGTACTDPTQCGTITAPTGGSGTWTTTYTPPASLAAATNVTLTVSSSLQNSFPATGTFTVFPAGTKVVKITGIAGGIGTKSLSVNVFNDSSNLGATIHLLAAGYACPVATGGGTICGTLTTGATTTNTTTSGQGTAGIPISSTAITYTPPTVAPNSPYDRPMILAVSNADPTVRAQINFPLFSNGSTSAVVTGPLGAPSRLFGVLTGGAPTTLVAGFGTGTGVNKTAIWTLTANGANCQPTCGVLGTPSYTWNGANMNTSITYTPPASVPSGAAKQPVITVTAVDPVGNPAQQLSDSTYLNINDGTCGKGNNAILNGQYAFLLQGGGESAGYAAFVGSFTADGNGNITGGVLDVNRTTGAVTDTAIASAGSSYSIGSDNRGCLTLAFATGGFATYRISMGTLDGSNHATQGRMVRFDDDTGAGVHSQGAIMRQDSAAFVPISGKYAFGYQGITSAGARLAIAGVQSADGAGNLTNFDVDAADGQGNIDTNDTTGSGTYSTTVDANGRGTGKTNGTNVVFYVVNSSEILTLSIDPLYQSTPIISGEVRKQTVPSGGFTQTSLDGNSYVLYATGVDPANGGSATLLSQVGIAGGGNSSGENDANDNGSVTSKATSGSLTIASNGRAASADGSFVFYLIGTDSAFFVQGSSGAGSPNPAAFGYAQQQSGSSFTNASLSGQLFFGGGAPVPGGEFDSGTATFDGVGTMTINVDSQGSEGGEGSGTESLSYNVSSSPAGKVTLTPPAGSNSGGVLGFIVSGSRIVLMSTDTFASSPELILVQK
jgi:uncharacterized repeat protein (TIGR01451 family)